MKKILLIATGGTIASSPSEEGLTPTIDVKQLLSYIPGVADLCRLDGISIMNIDSTNMSPSKISMIAETICRHDSAYDGFVLSHGTDTMAYTAAALSYILKNLKKPVVLTGSQLPIEAEYTDAKTNLSDAIRFANEDIKGVFLAFDGLIISGTRAMKMRTTNADAFESINFPVVAFLKHGRVTYNPALFHNQEWIRLQKDTSGTCTAAAELCNRVLVLKIFPGIDTAIFDFAKNHYKGVIVEGFGIGGIPNQDPDVTAKIRELIRSGVAVVITTQCLYEGINLSVYEVGRILGKEKVIVGGDMTTEALTMKLMWALAHFDQMDEIKTYIETPVWADRSSNPIACNLQST